MSGIIIRATREDDLYVEWSKIVSAPLTWGTREQVFELVLEDTITLKESKSPGLTAAKREEIEKRFARADQYGSSCYIGTGRWDDDFLIYEDRQHNGLLPRARLKAFVESMGEDGEGDPDYSMLTEMDET